VVREQEGERGGVRVGEKGKARQRDRKRKKMADRERQKEIFMKVDAKKLHTISQVRLADASV
jgi:hypothetical protein